MKLSEIDLDFDVLETIFETLKWSNDPKGDEAYDRLYDAVAYYRHMIFTSNENHEQAQKILDKYNKNPSTVKAKTCEKKYYDSLGQELKIGDLVGIDHSSISEKPEKQFTTYSEWFNEQSDELKEEITGEPQQPQKKDSMVNQDFMDWFERSHSLYGKK